MFWKKKKTKRKQPVKKQIPKHIINRNPCVFDLENVICTHLKTHNAIHYGDESILILKPIQRSHNDTCPWRKN